MQWTYNTLPQKIRELPDFPGIQVSEEPPEDVLKRRREQRNWPKERELLGLCSGHRDEPQHFQTGIAPDLILFSFFEARCSNVQGAVCQPK